jgi:hypothetical protein
MVPPSELPPQRRISITEALEILLPTYPAHDAAVRLTAATHANKCRLWCNNNLLAPDYVTKALKVVAHVEEDGRWRAEVVSGAREAWQCQPGDYRFELDAEEVKALLPQAQKRTRGRPKGARSPVGSDDACLEEMDQRLRDGTALTGILQMDHNLHASRLTITLVLSHPLFRGRYYGFWQPLAV